MKNARRGQHQDLVYCGECTTIAMLSPSCCGRWPQVRRGLGEVKYHRPKRLGRANATPFQRRRKQWRNRVPEVETGCALPVATLRLPAGGAWSLAPELNALAVPRSVDRACGASDPREHASRARQIARARR